MNFANKSVFLVIGLLVVALAGLLAVQVFLLNYALDLKNQAFSRNVLTAISTTVQKMEASELASGVTGVLNLDHTFGDHKAIFQMVPTSVDDGDTFQFETMKIFTLNQSDQPETLSSIIRPSEIDSTGTMAFIIQASRQSMMTKVVRDLTALSKQPIDQRIHTRDLDSLLNQSLHEVGIEMSHHFGVLSAETDSLALASNTHFIPELRNSEYRSRLFPLDLLPPYYDLVLHFPNNRGFLYRQVWPLLASSLVFTLLIIGCFAYTIATIAAQRRLSEQVVGFINNMTHEFKTPISTVALASEAINRPDVLANETTLLRYNQMISDENSRMHKQVEKILQMAQLERGEFELKIQSIDLHDLITQVADSFSLQLEQHQGKLALELSAPAHLVQADMIHLANVIQNLLDNAIKYSPNAPDVCIQTRNENNQIVMRVTDKGVGISEHDQKHVFEKYYRCPTGNLHDVKGFGIGLSYVKLMVGAHHGELKLNSQLGFGTNVDICLPVAFDDQDLSDSKPSGKQHD